MMTETTAVPVTTTPPTLFTHPSLGSLRVIKDGETGDPWFVAKDVCITLDLRNVTIALESLDEDERSKFNLGRQGDVNIINEPGLYSLILRSRKPEAKQFKRWVTHGILPSIRKYGGYLTPEKVEEALLNPDTLITLATALKEERLARQEAQAARQRAETELTHTKPKAALVDATFAKRSGQSMRLMDVVRKLGKINLNSIKADLQRLGYLYKTSSNATYRAYRKFSHLFVERFNPHNGGKTDIYVTAEGAALLTKLYYANKLTKKGKRA